VALSTGPAHAFGEVEHNVGLFRAQLGGELGIGFQANDLADLGEGGLDRVDRLVIVPFGVRIRELNLTAGCRLVAVRVGGIDGGRVLPERLVQDRRSYFVRRFEIKSETDAEPVRATV